TTLLNAILTAVNGNNAAVNSTPAAGVTNQSTAPAGSSTPVNNDATTTLLNAILTAVNNTQPAVNSTPAAGVINQSTAPAGSSTPVNNDATTTLLNAILTALNGNNAAVNSTPAAGVINQSTAPAGSSTPVNNDATTTLLNAILTAVNNTQPAVNSTPAAGVTNQSTAPAGSSTPVNNDATTTLLNAILTAVNNRHTAVSSMPAAATTHDPIVQVMAPLMPQQSLNETSAPSLNTPSNTDAVSAMTLAFNQQRSMGDKTSPDMASPSTLTAADNNQAAATSGNVLFAADLFAQLKAASFNPVTPAINHSPAPFTLDLSQLVQPGGAASLAEQLQLIAQAQEGTTELKLHPASLGALDVRISLDGNTAHVQFASANATVRDALEAALPRLRDAFMQDGVNLGQVSVSDHASQNWRQPLMQHATNSEQFGDDADLIAAETTTIAPRSTLSALARKLDLFV
ncbi:flagellar hook-length control protein FliK, partial [Thiospirillum jenense]